MRRGDPAVSTPAVAPQLRLDARRRDAVTPVFRTVATRLMVVSVVAAILATSIVTSKVDLAALALGMPVLLGWAARAIPPDVSELALLSQRMVETVGMAIAGTFFAALLAIPLTLLGTRQLSFGETVYRATRIVMNASRGIDSFIFAILFVAAVGLGPFAGVIGIALHSCGSIAKLWSEAIDSLDRRPATALSVMGLSRPIVWRFAIIPPVLPIVLSNLLYVWEVNVRSSTVLGLVGAGGIGQELKNSVDLLQIDRLATILAIILVAVTVIDLISEYLRRRVL